MHVLSEEARARLDDPHNYSHGIRLLARILGLFSCAMINPVALN